jgi:hypothetical protein
VKFNQVVKGKRAVRVVDLPLVADPAEEPTSVKVALRVLSDSENKETVEYALKYAKDGGASDPKAGHPLYEMGIRIKTLHLACLDPDHPNPDSPDARFFSSEDEIRQDWRLGRDGIWYLYDLQDAWQDACSPQPSKMGMGEFYREVELLANSDDPFYFERFRPAMRASFARTMASQLWILLTHKSESGQSSATDSSESPKPAESASEPTSQPPTSEAAE